MLAVLSAEGRVCHELNYAYRHDFNWREIWMGSIRAAGGAGQICAIGQQTLF